MDNIYYVYAWRIKETGEVFYVGKGHGKRMRQNGQHNRNHLFKEIVANNECEPFILESGLTEELAYDRERYYINYYKKTGQAVANITDGGPSGGNVMRNWSKERHQEFIDKMTAINKKRCNTNDFKTKISKATTKRYQDPDERKKQSERARLYWSDKNNRVRQSEIVKSAIFRHPDMYVKRSTKMYKPCAIEYNGIKTTFQSRKKLETYLKEVLHLTIKRNILTNMMKNKVPYSSCRSKFKHLNGMLLYYEGVETIETTEDGRK